MVPLPPPIVSVPGPLTLNWPWLVMRGPPAVGTGSPISALPFTVKVAPASLISSELGPSGSSELPPASVTVPPAWLISEEATRSSSATPLAEPRFRVPLFSRKLPWSITVVALRRPVPPAASAMRICELPSTEVVPPPARRSAWLTVTVGMPEGADSRPPGPSSSSATVWLTLSWAMPLAITAISVAPGLRVDGPGMSAQPVQFAGVVQAPLAAFHWQVAAPALPASTHSNRPRLRRRTGGSGVDVRHGGHSRWAWPIQCRPRAGTNTRRGRESTLYACPAPELPAGCNRSGPAG